MVHKEVRVIADEVLRNISKNRTTYLEKYDGVKHLIKALELRNENSANASIYLTIETERNDEVRTENIEFAETDFCYPSYADYINTPDIKAFTYWSISESMEEDASVLLIRPLYKTDISASMRFISMFEQTGREYL